MGIYKGNSYMDLGANETFAVSPASNPNRAVGFTSGTSSLSIAEASADVVYLTKRRSCYQRKAPNSAFNLTEG